LKWPRRKLGTRFVAWNSFIYLSGRPNGMKNEVVRNLNEKPENFGHFSEFDQKKSRKISI